MPRVRNTNGVHLRSKAYDLLRQALMLRQIPEGERLRETEWTVRLGVNRSAFREACGRLYVEGLIVEGEKGGYFSPSPEASDIQEVLEVRALLESGAIERICRLDLNRPENLRPLTELCDELEWLLRRGYTAQLTESDRRFHDGLITLAANKRMDRLSRCVPPAEAVLWTSDGQEWLAAGQTMLHEHRRILAAVEKGRVPDAQKLLRSHLMNPASAKGGVGVA